MNFPPHCQTISHSFVPSQRPSQISLAMFRAMGDFHRSVEIAQFLPMNFPPNCQTICHPKDRHRFLLQCSEQWAMDVPGWVPKLHGKKNRSEIATDSPPNRHGWQPSLLGPGGWGRPTLPRGTSQFCVCTSSAQCSDSFKPHVRALKAELNLPKLLHPHVRALKAELNLPKLLHQARFAETPFSETGGRKRQFAFGKPALVRQHQTAVVSTKVAPTNAMFLRDFGR